jgi:hypothetical protein
MMMTLVTGLFVNKVMAKTIPEVIVALAAAPEPPPPEKVIVGAVV